MSHILKLLPNEQNEEAELLAELRFQLSLTTARRFEMVFRNSLEIK
jgi:hypothetical protein